MHRHYNHANINTVYADVDADDKHHWHAHANNHGYTLADDDRDEHGNIFAIDHTIHHNNTDGNADNDEDDHGNDVANDNAVRRIPCRRCVCDRHVAVRCPLHRRR